MFTKLGERISRRPVKTVMIVLILGLATLAGALFVTLKTGNDTFINTDTDVYQNTQYYAENYGDTPIIIMFDPSVDNGAVDLETLSLMEGLEKEARTHDSIFNVVSAATVLRNMSEKQQETFLESLEDMEAGLLDAEAGLRTFSVTFEELRASMDENMLEDLNETLTQLSDGQDTLEGGLLNTSENVETMATALLDMSESLRQKGEAENDQELLTMASQLEETALNLGDVPEALETFSGVAGDTEAALISMNEMLQDDLGSMFAELSDMDDAAAKFSDMADGLSDMAEGLGAMRERSDMFKAGLPAEKDTLDAMLYETGELRPAFENVVVDDTYAVFTVSTEGMDEDASQEVIETLEAHLDDSDYTGEYLLSGKSVLDASIKNDMRAGLPELLAMAVGVMVAILLITFHVRWRIMPLLITMFAVVITIGAMGYMNVPITMVSMAVFPILIGLGIDYSIEFQNRYSELLKEGEDHAQ